MKFFQNKEVQGLCLCLAMMGLTYALLLLLLILFTGIKLYKTVLIVAILSSILFTLGLNKQVKSRLKQQLADYLPKSYRLSFS
ncbi:MAG: TfoX/Sxy family transcriptional regulator of competence genes [Colwellia sp.]|jgi:TfoX/Sxy family transcriptional regulator of competence genes